MATNAGFLPLQTESLHGGINRLGDARKIDGQYATDLLNFDAGTPGVLFKRPEWLLSCTLGGSGSINGSAGFKDANGQRWMVFARGGKLYKWDGTVGGTIGNGHVVEITPMLPDGTTPFSLHATNPVRFAQANTNLYLVDGANYLCRMDGTNCRAVIGTATDLPIIPTTLLITDGTVEVTDNGTGGLLLDGEPWDGASVNYATGTYIFPSNPWGAGLSVFASWQKAAEQPQETFIRAAQDGTLQYPALLNAPITHSTLTLTDGVTTLTTNNLDAGVDYPAGWKQILSGGGPYGVGSVVGAYEPATGKFMVTVGVFLPDATIHASYTTPTGVGSDTGLACNSSLNGLHGADYSAPGGLTHFPVAIGTNPDDVGILFTNFFAHWNCRVKSDGSIYKDGDVSNIIAPPGDFNLTTGRWNAIGYVDGDITETWEGSVTYTYEKSVANEVAGVSDSGGRLYRFKTSQDALAAKLACITDGTHTVTGTPGSGPLLDAGSNVVGSLSINGVVNVNEVDVFTPGSEPVITYYKAVNITGKEVINGALAGALGAASAYFGASDVVWTNNRLYLAKNTYCYYSDALAPETISQVPKGTGVPIYRLLPIAFNQILLFCGPGTDGDAVYTLNASGSIPSMWPTEFVFGGIALRSPSSICRASTNASSDTFYDTKDGLRSVKLTSQDAVSGPTLTLDMMIRPLVDALGTNYATNSFMLPFKDELFRFVVESGDIYPKSAYVWNIARSYVQPTANGLPQDGWTRISLPLAVSTGLAWDFGSGRKLFVGTAAVGLESGAHVYQMFAASTTDVSASVTTKAFTGGPKEADIIPQLLTITADPAYAGDLSAYLIDDQNREYYLGDMTVAGSAPTHNTFTIECRDTQGILPSSKSWRVKLTTTDYIRLQGWTLLVQPDKMRFVEQDESQAGAAIVSASLKAASIASKKF